jgi:HAD superfamily hydrolase (TIGR01509 family)
MVAALRPLPGVLDWIQAARERDMGVAIVSSSPVGWVERHLENLAMVSLFDFLMTFDRVDHAKPHPQLYERALAEYGFEARDAIAVEDSPHGVSAAKAAGIFCVAVPGPMTCHLPFEMADELLDSLASRSLHAVVTGRE